MAGRLSGPGGRRLIAGVADQALVSVTTAGLLFVAALVLPRREATDLLYSAQIIVFLQGMGRAFIGDVLLTYAARFDAGPKLRRQFDNAHATAAVLAVVGMIGVGCAMLAFPSYCPSDLLWALPFIPAILLQDLARYTYQTTRDQSKALLVDLIWVGVEVTALVAVLLTGRGGGGPILACWGAGAGTAVLCFYARTGINPLRGRPSQWIRDTRRLLGWYTATGILAQTTTLMIGTLVQGLLTKNDYAGFRLVQMVVLQPAQSLAMALNGLLVPRSSRLAGQGDLSGLCRQTRVVVTAVGLLGCAIVAVATLVADPVLRVFKGGMYADVAVIALPIALQTLVYLLQVPFTVAVRGLQQGRQVFAQYVVFSAAALTGLVTGASLGQLAGAAWGLCGGATIGLAAQVWFFSAVVTRMATPKRPAAPGSPPPAAPEPPAPAAPEPQAADAPARPAPEGPGSGRSPW
ncbi:MAG: hypothetical protein JXA67_19010 [Micromonosporaceae bacterium]|nr:hypothetical protein [Micromonosporaceae bacterium]